MYKARKAIVIFALTSVLLSIALFVSTFENTEPQDQIANLILYDDITIFPWHNEVDDTYYYFLPSSADPEDIHLAACNGNTTEILIDGIHYKDGDNSNRLELDHDYLISNATNTSGQKVKLLKSGNVSTIFVDTATGSMKSVLKSKKYREEAEITIIDENGSTVMSEKDTRISGRGNYTWDNADKKPFALLFSEAKSILGMAPSSKWALLANALDRSGIRNAIALGTARNVGMELTPEYRYVDLYLNGSYNGLYMLCQSPETFYERSDISQDDLYLFTAELPSRKKDAHFPIITPLSQVVIDVRLPETIREEEMETAKEIINRLDYSITKEKDDIGDILDLDSWTKRYLIDEIFENYDSGVASSYFYISENKADSKVYAGPIWDYDTIIGKTDETNNPEILYAMNEYRSDSEKILWYHDLYTNPLFYNEIISTFESSFVPQLEALIETDIAKLLSSTQEARRNNDLRWNIDSSDSYNYLTNYLSKRLDFLKRTWLENE